MESRRQDIPPNELILIEEQKSRIVFLEWKASSDARASREKMSDLTWKIESLQQEIETLNHDRACLKLEIVRLEASLFSSEESLHHVQASQVTNEKIKRECNDHLNEIRNLMAQNRRLKFEQAEFSQVTALKYVHLVNELSAIIRDCATISENIADVICAEANYQRSIVQIESNLTALRASSISCQMEVIDVRNALSKAFFAIDHVAKGLKDMIDLSIAANEETNHAIEHAKLLYAERRRLKQELSNFQGGMRTALTECIESRNEIDQLYRYMDSPSRYSGILSQLVCDLKAGAVEFDKLRNESLDHGYQKNEVYESASKIASRVHTFLRSLDLPSASSGLSQSVQCLKATLQRINETYTAQDESLSELSTVWADLDMSMRYLSQSSQFDILVQYLQGMTRPRSGCGMCLLGGKIYLAGGTDGKRAWDDIEYFDLTSKVWGVASKMPSARICFQLITTRDKLIALGGEDAEGNVLASCMEYDPKTDSWAELSPMNNCRTGFGALYVHSEGVIVVSGGWNGHSTTASTEIYEIDRDLWIDLESSEKDYSTSGCGITQFQSPVTEEWQVCSIRDIRRDGNDALAEDIAVDPLCYSLVDVEEMMQKYVSDTLSLNESLDKQVREQCREFCRYINIHQAARRKEKTEDCFNRAKIDSLKSQIISFRISEESESRSRAENSRIFSNGLYTIVQECVLAVQVITDLVQAEKAYLSSIIETSSQVCALQESIRACSIDVMNMHRSYEKVFSDVHYITTGLISALDLCSAVRSDVEYVGRGAAYFSAKAEQSKCRISLYQAGIKTAVDESNAALCDVLSLQQQLQDDLKSHQKTIFLTQNVCDDYKQIISDFWCLAESYKHLLEFQQTHGNTCVQSGSSKTDSFTISETNCNKEDGYLGEMIRLMEAEVIRRCDAENRVEMLTQMNFEVTKKYQKLMEETECSGQPKLTQTIICKPDRLVKAVPFQSVSAENVPLDAARRSEQQYFDEMIRLMGVEVFRRVEAEKMVEALTRANSEDASIGKKFSESKHEPICTDKKPNHLRKAGALDSILAKNVALEAVSTREQGHLDELIQLLGAEVIRRVEAEKTVETLTQKKSNFKIDCEFSERLKCRDEAPSSQQSSRLNDLAKATPSHSTLVEGVISEAARSSEHDHLDEMIRLMGAEVIRRVEAEKMVEMLSQINFEITEDFEKRISDASSVSESQNLVIHAQPEEKEFEISLLYEEKRILEAALELEIINNKTLRTEIFGLKSQLSCENESEMHLNHAPDADKQIFSKPPNSKPCNEDCGWMTRTPESLTLCYDQEIHSLKETVAARELELGKSEKCVQMFSEEMVLLFSKISLVLSNLQERRFLCIKGQCESGQRLQREVVLLLDQVAHEAEVAEKVRLLAQEELIMSAQQTQQLREKYESAAKMVLQLEQQIAILSTSHEQSLLSNMDLRRSLALVQSDHHSSANTLLWRFSHHAAKGCIRDLMADVSMTSSSDVSLDDADNKTKEKMESAVSLSCRGNKKTMERDLLSLSSQSNLNFQQSGLES